MSTYEWVIEQESPDGVTTRIVFDFADDDDDDDDNGSHLRRSPHGGSLASHSARHQGRLRSRGGGSRGSALALSTSSAPPLASLKDATRSEGGSSRRSSKRSNGSRSRRRPPHSSHSHNGTASSTGGVGNGIGGSGSSLLAPSGSAYTSSALRQRYHRMLFGDRGNSHNNSTSSNNGGNSATSGNYAVSAANGSSANTISTVNFFTRSNAAVGSAGGYSASPPPSTVFMSAYGAELADDEERSSGSYPARRSRASTNSSGSNGGSGGGSTGPNPTINEHRISSNGFSANNGSVPPHGMSGVSASNDVSAGVPEAHSALAAEAPWAAYTVNSVVTPPTVALQGNEPCCPPVDPIDSPARPSWQASETSPMDYVDDNDRFCHYVRRDVWADRATCPRTVTASACEFPAFPPLHPIPVDDDDDDEQNGSAVNSCPAVPAMNTAGESIASRQAGASAATGSRFTATSCSMNTSRMNGCGNAHPNSYSVGGTAAHASLLTSSAPCVTDAHAPEESGQRYNKMLLRKERQRGRGRGWQATTTGSVTRGWDAEPSNAARNRLASRPGLNSSTTNGNTISANGLTGGNGGSGGNGCSRRGMTGTSVQRRGVRRNLSSSSSSASSYDSDDADVEVGSDDTSIECLSHHTHSSSEGDSDSDDEEALLLRRDGNFAARVQSLANRAGRERRKMEAREEKQLQNELLHCEEALLLTPPMASLPASPTSPATPEFSLAAALRQRDLNFTTAGIAAMHSAEQVRNSALRAATASPSASSANGGGGGAGGRTPSSFFISPIHQSVAAESGSWAAGTRFQFLGQGGLGDRSATSSGVAATTATVGSDGGKSLSSMMAMANARGRGGGAKASGSRRRGRSDDNEEDDRCCGEDGEDGAVDVVPAAVGDVARSSNGAPLPIHHRNAVSRTDGVAEGQSTAPLSKSQARRARKQRKKGDAAQQSVVPQCGGSRALRPVAPPSMEPPLELLPCSKKEMCEDMLESFLMSAVLEDDDFKLL